LFGLSAYLATQRRQEIGIRKVLGASVGSVLGMFGKEYSKLILISFVVAIPTSLYLLQKWLSDFAYRVEITWWVIAATCMAVLFIAWATVSYHSIKTSLVNPAETLRNE
jgi:putative ABC transport system permease protein